MSERNTPDLKHLIEAVDRCRANSDPRAVRGSLAAAAALVENAAYELARAPKPRHVSSLILLAAELERIAANLPCDHDVP